MKFYIIGIAFLFFSHFSFSKDKTKDVRTTDVLVIGGTTSGTSAGIQSARLGINTLIVEETPWLGGMLTSAGVSATDGNNNLPSGIWNEYRDSLRARYGGEQFLATGWVSSTLYEPHVGDRVFKNMAYREKRLDMIYGYYLTGILKKGNLVTGAAFENENGEKLTVYAKITIDATDLGDGLKMAGAAYRLGMDARSETGESIAPLQANNIVQDLTWAAILKDYGTVAPVIPKPANYEPKLFDGCCDPSCDNMLSYGKLPNNKYMINWPRHGNDIYLNVVEMSRKERNIALRQAKNHTLAFVYHIQQTLGYRNLGLADDEYATDDKLPYMPYHREGRRLKGIVTLNYNDVQKPYGQNTFLYRTGISVGDYPVDHHHGCNPESPELDFEPVPSFNVPLGALIPEKINGLIVADKAISVTNLINGSTRLQPCVLLTGQAAGILAALSVSQNKQPRAVAVRQVQEYLLNVGAYIMPLYDVSPKDNDFRAIQRITATGILKTAGEPYGWANRTWFYPDKVITVSEFVDGLRELYPNIPSTDNISSLTVNDFFNYTQKISGEISVSERQKIWESVSEKTYSPQSILNRRETAVLLDFCLNPFAKQVNHRGEFEMSK
ncbi:MAG: FAD-dependent oxidoreductase [Dysgonamonadaceae bacterium]|jgi:hypothetical protein|nr:FAD-dependent oxidoreductase [Dysgonamonadaceae bacterium]